MQIEDVIAGLLAQHIFAVAPWVRPPPDGWHVVVGHSAYDPEGFSVAVNPPHHVINGMVALALQQMGLEVDWHPNYSAMEARPHGQLPRADGAPRSP